MKVIISSTPEVEVELTMAVCDILNATVGPLSFQKKEPLGSEILELIIDEFKSPDDIRTLSTDDLFKICTLTRKNAKLDNSDYMVLLTSIKTPENWLSISNGNDFFVDTNDWDEYSNIDSKFGITHQIIATLFHTFIKYEALGVLDKNSTHTRSIGCLMDYCDDRSEVMYKLRSGYICPDCIKKALSRGMTKEILVQFHSIIQKLRAEFVELELLQSMVTPLPIVVDSELKIKIGDTPLKLEPLPKTLYLYFLEQIGKEYVLKNSMNNKETIDSLKELYRLNRKGSEIDKVIALCQDIEDQNSSFITNKSALNRKIRQIIGSELSFYYLIAKDKNEMGLTVYKINLDSKYVKLEYKNNVLI